MKKKIIAAILFALAAALIAGGIYLGVSLSKGKNVIKPKSTEETETEVIDIFSAKTLTELEAQSKKDGLKFCNDKELPYNCVEGYKFAGRDTNVDVDVTDDGRILWMSFETFPFLSVPDRQVPIPLNDGEKAENKDENLNAETLKSKIDEAMNSLADRFHTKVDGQYYVIDKKSAELLDNTQPDVYEKIVNGEARLEFSIKTKEGEVWQLYVDNQDFYGGILFRLFRYTTLSEFSKSVANIDLSAG